MFISRPNCTNYFEFFVVELLTAEIWLQSLSFVVPCPLLIVIIIGMILIETTYWMVNECTGRFDERFVNDVRTTESIQCLFNRYCSM